jgi:hypothetical protein
MATYFHEIDSVEDKLLRGIRRDMKLSKKRLQYEDAQRKRRDERKVSLHTPHSQREAVQASTLASSRHFEELMNTATSTVTCASAIAPMPLWHRRRNVMKRAVHCATSAGHDYLVSHGAARAAMRSCIIIERMDGRDCVDIAARHKVLDTSIACVWKQEGQVTCTHFGHATSVMPPRMICSLRLQVSDALLLHGPPDSSRGLSTGQEGFPRHESVSTTSPSRQHVCNVQGPFMTRRKRGWFAESPHRERAHQEHMHPQPPASPLNFDDANMIVPAKSAPKRQRCVGSAVQAALDSKDHTSARSVVPTNVEVSTATACDDAVTLRQIGKRNVGAGRCGDDSDMSDLQALVRDGWNLASTEQHDDEAEQAGWFVIA